MRLLVVALLVACGSSRATPPGPPPPPPPPPPPNPEWCPPAFAGVSGACETPSANTCNYAEGSCYCGFPPPPCSGAAVDPHAPPPSEPKQWQCVAKPPAVRADGCPGHEPFDTPCSNEGKQCSYGSCCVRVRTCKQGRWRETAAECPP